MKKSCKYHLDNIYKHTFEIYSPTLKLIKCLNLRIKKITVLKYVIKLEQFLIILLIT